MQSWASFVIPTKYLEESLKIFKLKFDIILT